MTTSAGWRSGSSTAASAGGSTQRHRAPFKLDVVASNTWRAGLDRILLGVAMTEQDRSLVGGVLPLDDVESGAIELAGRMAEFVDRVQAAVDALGRAQTVDAWVAAIAAAADALTATPERESWQRAELERILDDVQGDATADGGDGDGDGDGQGRLSSSSPICGRCSPTASGAARRGPTSAPAISRSARSSRCARSRTASSACSGSTTASSRARRRATATTCCSTIPTSAIATPAPRIGRCCSTRSSPRPIG